MRGGEAPPLTLAPLSNHDRRPIAINGSGWRGGRGEVKTNNLMQTEPTVALFDLGYCRLLYWRNVGDGR